MTPEIFADRLLRDHAIEPQRLFYNIGVLGGAFGRGGVTLLDETYRKLADDGLMEPSGAYASLFGDPKPLYRITAKGLERSASAVAS